MRQRDPFQFWSFQPDGQTAFLAYEHIVGYSDGAVMQYQRIYDLWLSSSKLGDDPGVFEAKRQNMRQVVRDIHFLLISLQVVWKSLKRMCDGQFFPSFSGALAPLKVKWEPFFEQHREPRNTFEHYDDQIFGPDTRNNSPGYGVKLQSDGAFALGSHQSVLVNAQSRQQFIQFTLEFESAIATVVGPVVVGRRAPLQ